MPPYHHNYLQAPDNVQSFDSVQCETVQPGVSLLKSMSIECNRCCLEYGSHWIALQREGVAADAVTVESDKMYEPIVLRTRSIIWPRGQAAKCTGWLCQRHKDT